MVAFLRNCAPRTIKIKNARLSILDGQVDGSRARVADMIYDIIVIGAGCSGLAGAMYAARLGMKVLVLGEMRGGTITLTDIVENYPGFKSITGMDLGNTIKQIPKQAETVP